MQIGYKLAAESFGPKELVRQAVLAEQAGFDFVEMSDHYHPWLDAQGHSPFVWTVLGTIAAKTEHIGLATGVTCPTVRYHPAVVAQAAATLALVSDGRFTLGVGSGNGSTSTSRERASPTPCPSGTHGCGRRWRSSGCCGAAATARTTAGT